MYEYVPRRTRMAILSGDATPAGRADKDRRDPSESASSIYGDKKDPASFGGRVINGSFFWRSKQQNKAINRLLYFVADFYSRRSILEGNRSLYISRKGVEVVQSSHEEVEIVVEHDGEQETLRGVREGAFVRLSKRLLASHPAVRAAVRSVRGGESLNNVWAVIPENAGDPVRPGQDLLVNIRVGKRTGGFAIAAGVALGVIVAIEAIRRAHNEP